ncbi:MAG: PVC-type heme-binding CxxCH protein [Pirellulales bacterium]
MSLRVQLRRSLLSICGWSIVCFGVTTDLRCQTPPAKPEYDADLSAELPRIAPKTPAEEQATFEVQPGYRVELVAAEPLVMDPVAFAFGSQGELYVVEMRDYSEQETEHLGSIAKLVDTDGDGKMDKRTTFAEKLSWPTAIWTWRDGVLVGEPPRVLWLRDTDGDGVSDKQEVWFEGFGRSNVQGLVNSLRWSVDGSIHGATSSSGADLKTLMSPDLLEAISLRGRDFSIDPLTKKITPTSGGGQHGMAFNRWGDKFVTSNSDHLQQIIDLESWLSSHPAAVPIPALRKSIAVDGPQAEVYRNSPVEPWRIVRTRLRVSGAVPGMVEGGGRAAGYFTGATGTWIVDDSAGFGDPDKDTAFVCDVGSNLVHRKRMLSNGLFWQGERIDKESEFLRGSDIWFRPVQLGDGPDGALYIADMYREVIEHPKSLPPVIKRHLDLTSGNDKGRIWRVVPDKPSPDKQSASPDNRPPGALTNVELVDRLASSIAWQRRMAAQLLIERHAVDAVDKLTELVKSDKAPAGSVYALHVLHRFGKLSPEAVGFVLNSSEPRVAQHAAELASFGAADKQRDKLIELAASTRSPQLQLALARTAAAMSTDGKLAVLRSLMVGSKEPLTRAVIIVSAGNDSPLLFHHDASSPSSISADTTGEWLSLTLPAWIQMLRAPSSDSQAALRSNISQVLESNLSDSAPHKDLWIKALTELSGGSAAETLLGVLKPETRSKLVSRSSAQIESLIGAELADSDVAGKVPVVKTLRLLPAETRRTLAEKLFVPTTPEPLQSAAAESLLWADPGAGLEFLLPKLRSMTPTLKQKTLTAVVRYSQSLDRVATALEKKEIATSEIAPEVRQQLTALPDKKLQARFKQLLNTASADRAQVIDRYRPAVADAGDKALGSAVFQKVCAQCHRIGETGSDVGPPLKQLGDKSPEQLLDIILDPNREVDPKFLGYSALLEDGRVISGIIREESAGQIVMAEAGGKLHTLARAEITRLQSSGLSLMPVGLEEQISPEQMRNLIAFLKQSGK